MKNKFAKYWVSQRSGLTLIELLAGLVLLSTLLTGLVVGYRRHERQVRMARLRLDAVEAADRLLVDWFMAPETFPLAASGFVEHALPLQWETRIVEGSSDETLGIQRVQLAIRSPDAATTPLVAIELVMPIALQGSDDQAGRR